MENTYLYKLTNNELVIATEENNKMIKPHLVVLVPQESELTGRVNYSVQLRDYKDSFMGLSKEGEDFDFSKSGYIKTIPNDELLSAYRTKITGIVLAPAGMKI